MRRCYRGVALALGGILFAGNTFLNSCGHATLNVHAAENAPAQVTRIVETAVVVAAAGILTEEENVETEIPADEPDSEPLKAEEEIKENVFFENYKEYQVLLKIVEAEAGNEDITGKMLVANVIMNRVHSDYFPDTITEVVYQRHQGTAQFSPTADGRMESVTISQETVEAVRRVMNGEDSSKGALYFRSVYCDSKWHDNTLTRIIEHGNHIFYAP